MTSDDWQRLGQACLFVIIGGYTAYKAHKSEQQAKKAKEFAEPTGNGFAKNVKDALTHLQESALEQKQTSDRIEARQVQSESMLISHITAHANADVLKGTRGESPSDPNAP